MGEKTVRSRMRKRRGPMRETAFRRRVDAIKLPSYRYATKAFIKAIEATGNLPTAMKVELLCDKLGYRNAVSEYVISQFAKTGEIPVLEAISYDEIATWAEPFLRVTTLEPKRPKKRRERTDEEQRIRNKGNLYSRKIHGILAEGQRRGKIEVELRERLAKLDAKRNG